jgi:mannose-1-phosphate guanylyltransferase / mannose-6-phosphate isomerase
MKFLILAGGSGTRLWPLSRKYFAKQFLNLTGNNSLLQDTALRVSKDKGKDIYVISNRESKFIVNDQLADVLPDYKEDNLIVEPVGRNTAPAICFGTLFFSNDDIIAVLSSDHYIKNGVEFNRILDEASTIAEKGHIVTLGIIPDSPKTGYGYIKRSDKKIDGGYKVEKYVEKPDRKTAEQYVADGNYFWNAGIFIFKVSVLIDEIKKHAPLVYQAYEAIKNKRHDVNVEDFMLFPEISIDYAVMEKSDSLVVIPSDIGWSDIGSFQTLYDILPKDENENSVKAGDYDFININSRNLLIYGEKRKITAINLSDLVIIDTPDAVLVCDGKKTEDVKEAVKILQSTNSKETEIHNTIYRSWGYFTILETGKNFRVNKLFINPQKKISFHIHKNKSETWTVVEGIAEIIKEDIKMNVHTSESVFIPKDTKHQIFNPSFDSHLKIIEVQIGDHLDEDDIIRLEEGHRKKQN